MIETWCGNACARLLKDHSSLTWNSKHSSALSVPKFERFWVLGLISTNLMIRCVWPSIIRSQISWDIHMGANHNGRNSSPYRVAMFRAFSIFGGATYNKSLDRSHGKRVSHQA